MKSPPNPHYRHRFPADIIRCAVWLYHVFSLSLRDVELLLAQRGIIVSYETVRRWCQKFGESFADRLRRRRPRPGDKWHLDEVFIRIEGAQHYLCRAVDQYGVVLDVLVQERRGGKAAKRFFKRLLKGLQYVPRVIITDKLRSYGVAQRSLLPNVEHRQSRYLNNHADNSHRPTRRRERLGARPDGTNKSRPRFGASMKRFRLSLRSQHTSLGYSPNRRNSYMTWRIFGGYSSKARLPECHQFFWAPSCSGLSSSS